MSVGFIMYEIVDMDSLKYQGINTATENEDEDAVVGYSLKYQGINTDRSDLYRGAQVGYSLKSQGINTVNGADNRPVMLDIHLKIKVLTP